MPLPPLHSYSASKQTRKASSNPVPHLNNPSPPQRLIKPSLLWSFDSPRKDAKRQARLRCIKYFYALELKLCNKDYRYLRCLKSDKPCCRHLVLRMDKPNLNTNEFPDRKHHMKHLKVIINSKARMDLDTKFWKRISPQITALDYISNEVANFKQLITESKAYRYRKLKNFSFPIVRHMDDIYTPLFNFLRALYSLKILSFNTVSTISPEETSQILKSLNHLSHLRGLNIILKGNSLASIDMVSQTLQDFHKLCSLGLQFGKIHARHIQELLLDKEIMITQQMSSITHLELEIYLDSRFKEMFTQFLGGLESLYSLVSLDLTIERGLSSFKDTLELPQINNSILNKVKYLSLEGGKHGIGLKLAEYFLSKTGNLKACHLKNIEIGKRKDSKYSIVDYVLKNKNISELKIVFEDWFDASALEKLFEESKELKSLQLFSVQLHGAEPVILNLETLIKSVSGLQNADTIVIEILFPIQMNITLLSKLFENLAKLKRLSGLKMDLRLSSEVKGSSVRKLFMLGRIDVITLIVENMKLTKEDQKFIKEHSKRMKKITSCYIECEDFKMDRIF